MSYEVRVSVCQNEARPSITIYAYAHDFIAKLFYKHLAVIL